MTLIDRPHEPTYTAVGKFVLKFKGGTISLTKNGFALGAKAAEFEEYEKALTRLNEKVMEEQTTHPVGRVKPSSEMVRYVLCG